MQVAVIALNDGPTVQFNSHADINKFASLTDRSHALGLTEEGRPVFVMPNTTTVADIDSTNAGGATIHLSGITDRLKESLRINKSLADSLFVSVNVSVDNTSVNITLSGRASFGAYRQVQHKLHIFSLDCCVSSGVCRSY